MNWKDDIDTSRCDVWRYAQLFDVDLPSDAQILLGDTTAPLLSLKLDNTDHSIDVLREDLNPNGSHKDRSLAVQVSVYGHQGHRHLCISSSGNAAIAGAAAAKTAGIKLTAFVSPRTSAHKVARLCANNAQVVISSRAIGLCKEFSEATGAPNLRPSIDDLALEGYKALAYRLCEEASAVDSIFCYASSGSTLCGLKRGYDALTSRGWQKTPPALHAAQAGRVAAIAAAFGESPERLPATRSVVGDLGVKRSRRQGEVVRAIRATGGHAWWMTDEAILSAMQQLEAAGLSACLESACATAAALKALVEARVHRPLVILTGHAGLDGPPWEGSESASVFRAESLQELSQKVTLRQEPE